MDNQSSASPTADASESTRRTVGVCTGLAILALALSTVLSVLVTIIAALLGHNGETMETSSRFLLVICSQLGIFLIGQLYPRWYGIGVPIRFPTKEDIDYTVIGMLLTLGFASGALAVVEAVELVPNSPAEEPIMQGPMMVVWMVVLSVLVIAPAEEYLFRGVIQRRLRERFNVPGAIFGASLLFGSLHVGNLSSSLETALVGTLIISGVGVVYGFLYERTGTLIVPITGHALYNVVLYTGYYLVA